MRILTVFTQPIENNTSSMIRCRNVLNGIASIGNEVVIYSPYPDKQSIYYGEIFNINDNITIRRYGEQKKESKQGKTESHLMRNILLKIYRKFDLFGLSIVNVKYTDYIFAQIKDEKFDMLFSFSSPIATHIISNKIYDKNKKVRYVQQWGDPLASDTTRKSFTPKCIQKFIESKLIAKAHKIYYVSPLTLIDQQKQFRKYANKMEYVPTPSTKRLYGDTLNKRLHIGYFGSYQTSARNIMPFYGAAKACVGIEFLIVGDSDINLKEEENIRIVNRTTPDEIEKFIMSMDVIVCLMNTKGSQIPGKTYNYACTDKEILMILDSERKVDLQNFFEHFQRFTFVKNQKEEIMKVFQTYMKQGVPSRTPVKEFSPEIVATKMTSI